VTELAMCLLPLGVAAILWVVLGHRSTMAHLQARRDGSIGNEYDRGVRDGLVEASEILKGHAGEGWSNAGYASYVEILKRAAGHD